MKKIISIALAAVMMFSLAACGGSKPAQTTAAPAPAETTAAAAGAETTEAPAGDVDFSKQVKLTYGISGAAGVGTAVAIQKAIDLISERSNGAIEVELVTDGALGNEGSMLQQVMEGSLDICGCAIGTVSQYSEYLSVFQMPFLINNYELEGKVLLSDEWKALVTAANADLETATIVSATEFGMRGIATIGKAVTSMADVKGLKIRTGGNPVIDAAVTKLGANPTAIPFTELYSSLQNKVVDGEEINLTSISMQKHYEVVTNYTDIGFYPWLSLGIMSNSTIESLPEGYYELICECIAEADADYMANGLYDWVKGAEEDCAKNGLVISELTDKADWIALMDDLYKEWSAKNDTIANFISSVQAMDK